MSYKITDAAKKRFKVWLVQNDLNIGSFAEKCGCKRQYIQRVLGGSINVTPHVIEVFKKGGYDLL